MRNVAHIAVGLALLMGCGGSSGSQPEAVEARGAGLAKGAEQVVPAGTPPATAAVPLDLEQHRLQRVQELREDRAAAEAHAAKAVEQARVVSPAVALPDGVTVVTAAEVAARREARQNVLLVDPRPAVAFRRAHAVGASNVLADTLAIRAIPDGATIVLVGPAGDHSVAVAARALLAREVPVEVIAGGLEAWEQAGQAVLRLDPPAGPDAPIERVAPAALLAGTVAGELLDVRPRDAWAGGHLPKSRNVPLAELEDAPLPSGEALVVAADDAAAERAARTLLARGAGRVRIVEGGVLAWVRAGGRLESGRQQ
jgi:rhodanese-related sulfurtransferase